MPRARLQSAKVVRIGFVEAIVQINQRGVGRVRGGHLWVYKSDVRAADGVAGGLVVRVEDSHGRFVGRALYSDRSQIALRFLTQRDETIDLAWWRRKIQDAASRRDRIPPDTTARRLVHGEGDLLPSLVVDRYGDVLTLQTLSQGTDAIKGDLVAILEEVFSPSCIVERNDVKVRDLEGLAQTAGVVRGRLPENLEVKLNGVRMLVSPLTGQKTGAFLDQRENYLAARLLGRGRALDAFSFSGGFALHLASVCDSVLALDVSEEAVALGRQNAALNQAANIEFRAANVFDAMREMEAQGEQFDTVVLDPPAFAKNRASVPAALRGYKEINLRALKLLRTGGRLITCTCSYHMDEGSFLHVIAEAARDARRALQLVEKRMQAADHPVLIGVPETHYLKCLILRVVD